MTGRWTPRAFERLAILMLAILTGCTSTGLDPRPTLRVGIAPDDPPFVFEQDGVILGIEADLIRIAADQIGRRVVFMRHPRTALFEALESGEVDVIIGGIARTPALGEDRPRDVRLTESFMQVGQLALIRASDVGRYGHFQAIKRGGVRVGYERGSAGETYVAEELPRAESFAFEDVAEGLRSLRAGRIDYFIHDAPTIWSVAGDPIYRDLLGLYRPLTEEYLVWAVRADDTALLRLLNVSISHWKREGRIETILDLWIPLRVHVR